MQLHLTELVTRILGATLIMIGCATQNWQMCSSAIRRPLRRAHRLNSTCAVERGLGE